MNNQNLARVIEHGEWCKARITDVERIAHIDDIINKAKEENSKRKEK